MLPSLITKSNCWKIIIVTAAVVINASIFSSLLWGSNSMYTWKALKEKRSAMETELAALNTERSNLSREIRLLKNDPSSVEKIIRQRLNYVKQNEILYIFEDSDASSFWGEDLDKKGTKRR